MKKGPAKALAALFAVAVFGLLETADDYFLRHTPKSDVQTRADDPPPRNIYPVTMGDLMRGMA